MSMKLNLIAAVLLGANTALATEWEKAMYSFTADCEGKVHKSGTMDLVCTHQSLEMCAVYGVSGQDAMIYWGSPMLPSPVIYGTIPSGEFPKWLQSESIMEGKVKDFIQKLFCDGRGQKASVKAAGKGFQVRPEGAIVPPTAYNFINKSIFNELSSPAARTFVSGVTSEAMASRAQFAKTSPTKLSSVAIPDHFDSEANWPECAKVIGDIRDQSNCGCCWAFGAASAASDRLCISTKGKVMLPLSDNDVCFCASNNGCGGGDIVSPWEFIKAGVVSGGQFNGTGPFGSGYCNDWSFPHCHHHGPQRNDPYPAEGQPGCPSQKSPQCPTKCDSAAADAHKDFADEKWGFEGDILKVSGADHIAQTIMEGGPVETAFAVYADFANYSGGIYEHKTGAQLGAHAVRIVGFGTENRATARGTFLVKYWKVANSWNPYWGEKGYFRIVRGTNNCGIEDMVTASSPDAKWAKKAGSTVVV